jgi:hypothetical protein
MGTDESQGWGNSGGDESGCIVLGGLGVVVGESVRSCDSEGVGDNVAEGAELAHSPRPLSACGGEGGHEFSIFSQGWGLVTGAG